MKASELQVGDIFYIDTPQTNNDKLKCTHAGEGCVVGVVIGSVYTYEPTWQDLPRGTKVVFDGDRRHTDNLVKYSEHDCRRDRVLSQDDVKTCMECGLTRDHNAPDECDHCNGSLTGRQDDPYAYCGDDTDTDQIR